jgi:hypothetical protein
MANSNTSFSPHFAMPNQAWDTTRYFHEAIQASLRDAGIFATPTVD